MRKKLLGLCFIIVVYSIFLVATMPAKTALFFVTLPRIIQIEQVTGTIWNGHSSHVKLKNVELVDVSWDTSFTSLISGRIEMAVEFGRNKRTLRGNGVVGYGFAGPFAHDFTVKATSEWLVEAAELVLPVTTKGDVTLQLSEVTLGRPWCRTLDGQLSWKKAGVDSLFGHVVIGNADADLSCDNGDIVADFKQSSSHARLTGNAKLKARGQYVVSATFVPGDELPRAIRSNLGYVGKPNSKGEYKLDYKGRI